MKMKKEITQMANGKWKQKNDEKKTEEEQKA